MNSLKVSLLSLLFLSNSLWISDGYAMEAPDEIKDHSQGGNVATGMPEVQIQEDFETRLKNACRTAVVSKNPEVLLSLLRVEANNNINAREELCSCLFNPRKASIVGLTLTPEHIQEAKDIYRLGLKQRDRWAENYGREIGRKFLADYKNASSASVRQKLTRELIGQWSGFISEHWCFNPISLTVNLLRFEDHPINVQLKHCLEIELMEHLLKSGEPYHTFDLVRTAIESGDNNKLQQYLGMAKKLNPENLTFNVRSMAQFGLRGKVSCKTALELYLIAADQGCQYSMFWAAEIIERGFEGQAPNLPKALFLYEKAANLGSLQAMHNAGLLLSQGFEGQAPNEQRALQYFTCAADQGFTNSMLLLGVYYLYNNKLGDSIFWLEKARLNRSSVAVKYLEIAKQFALELKPIPEAAPVVEAHSDQQLTQLIESTIEPVTITGVGEHFIKKPDLEDGADWSGSSNDEELDDEISPHIEEGLAEQPDFPKPNFDFQKLSNNPKFIREQLRKLGQKKSEIDQLGEQHKAPTDTNRDIVERIKNLDAKLNDNDIFSLFKDPYFKNEVLVSGTKNGIKVKSIRGFSTSTHRKHTKDYDGYHRNFLKDLKKVLESFSL
jgi:TPR repeat protein